ncbi:MAG TPA: sorbosone dehydrogenase family protein [Methylomirabilota bacterium]|jgi:glucose/arabinose dehydrogenase|nr:sorbosone dehydrogenase family protein [Methylomirabilota bacterium]
MTAMLARAILGIVAGLALVSPSWAQAPSVSLPPGFHLEVFASDLGGPRFMTLDPAGTLLVSVPSRGRVVALPDKNGHGKLDAVVTVAEGLTQPHGLAFKDGQLYVAETGQVVRFHYDSATMKASQPIVVVPSLPTGGHWTRTIAFGPDGRLYVSIGSSCNICRESDSRRAAIMRYRPDGSGGVLFASGLRNAVGIAFHPSTGVLWATVNERDWLGDDVPPDLITEVRERGFYGWPDCFAAGGKTFVDSRVLKGDRCPSMTAPSLEIQAHSAPLGLAFYTGQQFPAEYRGSLFVAYHGSWNRSVPTGYKVVRIKLEGAKATAVEDFATGFLSGGTVSARPVDLVVGRDGALFLSSDQFARDIFRITYRPR